MKRRPLVTSTLYAAVCILAERFLLYIKQKRTGANCPKTIPACSFLHFFIYNDDVGVKRYFDPFDTGLFRTSYSHNPQKHSQFARFSSKNGYLLMFLAGPKFRKLPASKLASDFWTFDLGIIKYGNLNPILSIIP